MCTFLAGLAPPVPDDEAVALAPEGVVAFFFFVFFLPAGFVEDFGEVAQRGNSFSISFEVPAVDGSAPGPGRMEAAPPEAEDFSTDDMILSRASTNSRGGKDGCF